MKNILLTLLLLACSFQLFAIEVSGSQSGTWTPENNPYQVVGAITVPVGSNLNIQPGVMVHIMGNFQITIAGTMNANGTPGDSIRFVNMQANPTALWAGLRFENTTAASQLSYVYIEYGTYGIRNMNAHLTINHCRINRCEKGMELFAAGAAASIVLVEYNLIENCIQNGILITQCSGAQIENNEIRYNGTGAQFRAAIQLANQSAGGSCNPTITNNHIHHNFKQGISAWDSSSSGGINPQILNNIIEYNYTGIYLLQTSGYVADNQINYNFIPGDMNSGAGVMVSGVTSEPYFERNHVEGNYTGFYVTNNAKPVLGDLSIYHAWAQGENVIVNNIDANGVMHSVFCDAYPNAANVIMAENNNWGSDDAAEIAVGINDHIDNAALPTVDFEPFISNISPTSIIGNYVYVGQSNIIAARLELISTDNGAVLHTFPLTGTNIEVTAAIAETFYAMIVLSSAGDVSLYGCAGGFLAPQVFAPGDLAPVDIGTIEVWDTPPPRYELIGEATQDGVLTLYPLMHGFALYGWRSKDWVYANGDYLYLKRNIRRTQAGEVVTDLPLGTIYKKYLNIMPGDTWSQTEIIAQTGAIVMSTVKVDACVSAPGMSSFRLITRTNTAGDVADKMILDFGDPLFFSYDNSYMTTRESIRYFGDPESLAPNSGSLFLWQFTNWSPWFLFNDPDLYNEALNQPQVRLFWQAPGDAAAHPNWTHYRIYRNLQLIDTIPFVQSEYTDLTWTGDYTTTYLVRAWDGFVESESSNELYVMVVSNEDELLKPVTLSLYPNPVAVSKGQNLDIRLTNLKNRNAELKIFNLKGQKVHSAKLSEIEAYKWNGCDVRGKACASGVYFLKVEIKGEKPFMRKIVIQ